MVQSSQKLGTSASSFSSVILGAIIAAAIAISFSALSLALGFGSVDVNAQNPLAGVGTAAGIPSVIGIIIGIAIGGFVAGRLAGAAGYSHGLATWASLLILAALASAVAAGGAIRATSNVASSVIAGTGSAIGGAAQGTGSALSSGFDAINTEVLGDVNWKDASQEVRQTLRDTKIEGLQPEQLEATFKGAAQDIKDAARAFAINPSNGDAILNELGEKLKQRAESKTSEFDRDAAVTALVNNGWERPDAEKAVDNAKALIDKSGETVKQGVERAQQTVAEIQKTSEEFKNKARQAADDAASAASKASLWTFIAAVLGALVAAFSGQFGVRSREKTDIVVYHTST